MSNPTNYAAMKIVELRKLCKERSILESGKKADLINRLETADEEKEAASKPASPKVSPKASPKPSPKLPPKPVVPVSSPKIDPTVTTASLMKKETAGNGTTAAKTDEEVRAERQQRFGHTNEKEADADKRKQRAQRFGTQNEELDTDKLKERAKRFGGTNPELEKEKLKERQARFGAANGETEADKKKARGLRFGLDSELPGSNKRPRDSLDEAEQARVQKRKERFGIEVVDESEKKELRKQRFGA